MTSWVTEEYFETQTAAVVFGDVRGYEYLRDSLLRARTSASCIDLSEIPQRSNSMRVVLTPAPSDDKRTARLKLIERIVFRKAAPEMETVLHGNRKGYDRLAQTVTDLLAKSVDRLHDHEHVDDLTCPWVMKRSIGLNIRGPVARWSRKAVAAYQNVIFEKGKHYLPDDIGYLDRQSFPYQVPSSDNRYLKLM